MKISTRLLVSASLLLPVLCSWSRVPVEAQVPSFREAVGHGFGERITQHHEMVRYLEALARTSDRVAIELQGETWEGRELPLAIVTSPANHARLKEIREGARRLGDARITSRAAAAQLIETQPVIIWYGGSIHGFELSGSEGVLKLLERLTTAGDPATLRVLDSAVILIDPMLNPDGRDAFAHLNHENIGAEPNPMRDDWANDFTSWQALKFRTGHYYFDTNRDWFAQTQMETRARVPALVAWRPQLVIDMHEMGADAEFYFDPATDPWPPHFPPYARRIFNLFNGAYAAAFDSAGYEYMTRERYNYFYPGYTTSFGSYQGAAGMLYEQGSSRGLALTRADGSVRTLKDALEQQYLAAWTAAATAADRRSTILNDYYAAQVAAIDYGETGITRYVIPRSGDPNIRRELGRLLLRDGIEVSVLVTDTRMGELTNRAGKPSRPRVFEAGSYLVEVAQPRSRLIRALLGARTEIDTAFLELARSRVDRDENPRFYDITSWSLPLLFNLEVFGSRDARAVRTRPLAADSGSTEFPAARPAYAYLVDGSQAGAVSLLFHLRHEGFRAAMLDAPTRLGGRDFSSGTVVVRTGQNPPEVHEALREMAHDLGLAVAGVATGLPDTAFPALGSGDHAIPVKTPEIALLAEDPVSAYSFGWAWYTLDQQYRIPVTVLRTRSVRSHPLKRFNVLIVPDVQGPALARTIGEEGVERIQRWVRDGGTLVTIGGATEFARRELKLLSLRSFYETEEGKEQQRFNVPGAFFLARLNHAYWLTAGYEGDKLPVLVNSSRVYLAPEGPPSSRKRVVALYSGGTPVSGHAWDESIERLENAVFVYEERVGAGRVIAFAEDPNFRGYWRGANRLFLNAVVVGPSGR